MRGGRGNRTLCKPSHDSRGGELWKQGNKMKKRMLFSVLNNDIVFNAGSSSGNSVPVYNLI